jgi:hypothetical protein
MYEVKYQSIIAIQFAISQLASFEFARNKVASRNNLCLTKLAQSPEF